MTKNSTFNPLRIAYFILPLLVIAVLCLFATKPGNLVLKELKSGLMGKGRSRAMKRLQYRLKALNKDALQIPWLHVFKKKRILLFKDGAKTLATFPVALGSNPVGHTQKAGDGRTPEGEYYICYKNENSRYHLYLGVSYPSPADAQRGMASGIISASEAAQIQHAWSNHDRPPWNTALGGAFGLHGYGIESDWTEGTIAMINGDIEEIFWNIPMGTKIVVSP